MEVAKKSPGNETRRPYCQSLLIGTKVSTTTTAARSSQISTFANKKQ